MITTADFKIRLNALFTTDIADAVLSKAVTAAVAFYSRYNPRHVQTTLSLIVDTTHYDMPADFLALDWFDWWPEGEPAVPTVKTADLWEAIYNIRTYEARARRLTPYVRTMGGQLVLNVAPTEAADVDYAYLGVHTVASSNYPTIPDVDEAILLKLAVAEMLELRMPQITVTPEITEGLLALQWARVPPNTAQVVSMLRDDVKRKYGGF